MMFNVKEIIRNIPKDLQQALRRTWYVPQNPKWHPEGNTFKHIFITIQRACDTNDKNLIMCALFHDLGKYDVLTFNTETRLPVAHKHEHASCFYVYKFRKYIKEFEADPLTVLWLVKNHMRMKVIYDMRYSKQMRLKVHPSFLLLVRFRYEVDGGGFYKTLIR